MMREPIPWAQGKLIGDQSAIEMAISDSLQEVAEIPNRRY